MNTSSLAAYVDAVAVNDILRRWFNLNPAAFEWKASGTSPLKWSLDVKIPGPPVVSFGPQGAGAKPGANIGIRVSNIQVSLTVTILSIPITLPLAFDVALSASLATAGERIVLGDFSFSIQFASQGGTKLTEEHKRSGLTEKLLDDTVKDVVVPELQKWVLGLPLPQIHELFGTDLDVTLVDVSVPDVHGTYMLCAIAELSRHAGAMRALRPPPAPPETVRERGLTGKIILLVTEQAVNLAGDTFLEGHIYPFRQTRRECGTKMGLKARVRIDTVGIHIPGPVARTSAKATFRKPRGGIKCGGSWTWIRINIKNVSSSVDMSLDTRNEGRTGNLVIEGIRRLDAEVKRGECCISARTLDDLLDDAIDDFLPEVNRQLRSKPLELFRLPETIPGTKIPVDLQFAPDGLRFSPGLVVAEVLML
jgi:hypothetical protein